MKQTAQYLRQQVVEAKDLFMHQWKAFAISLAILMTLYLLSISVPVGWATYFVMLPAAFVVLTTAYARLNALGPEFMGWQWQLRRVGFTLVGVGAISLIGTPFMEIPKYPSWIGVLLTWGLALTWITTPNMVPWDWYLAGKYRLPPPEGELLSPLQRLLRHLSARNEP